MFSFNNLAIEIFVPKAGVSVLVTYIIACILLGAAFIFGLMKTPNRYRKPIIIGLTFVLGLVYFMEFMFPGRSAKPIRTEIKAAKINISAAQQDVYALILHRGSRSERIDHAQRSIDSALNHLAKADRLLKNELPKAIKEAEMANTEAERWIKAHDLPDSYVNRDSDNKVDDARTKARKKRVRDLTGAAGAVTAVTKELETIKIALATAKDDELRGIYGSLMGGSDLLSGFNASLADNFMSPYMEPLSNATMVIGSLAFALGLISLGTVHGHILMKRRAGWGSSLAFFIALITMMLAAFLQEYLGKGTFQSISKSIFDIYFKGALRALSATMFSLVAFYIVSAAYRAFRIRSAESALMLASAFIIMLALVPFGAMITNGLPVHGWMQVLRLEKIGTWILMIPNAAAQRGMQFGIGVGALAMALRIWLSLERGSYFDKQM